MEYQLIFSSRLDLPPNDFVVAWNAEEATRTVAQANLAPGEVAAYDPLVDLVSLVLTNVGLGLGTSALYDLIKLVFVKKDHRKHIRITRLDQPDGTHLLTVDIEE